MYYLWGFSICYFFYFFPHENIAFCHWICCCHKNMHAISLQQVVSSQQAVQHENCTSGGSFRQSNTKDWKLNGSFFGKQNISSTDPVIREILATNVVSLVNFENSVGTVLVSCVKSKNNISKSINRPNSIRIVPISSGIRPKSIRVNLVNLPISVGIIPWSWLP